MRHRDAGSSPRHRGEDRDGAAGYVYVQKPLTYTVREGRVLLDLAEQTRSAASSRRWAIRAIPVMTGGAVVELIRGGVIGRVSEVHVWTNRPVWPQARRGRRRNLTPPEFELGCVARTGGCGLGLSPGLCAFQLARLGAVRRWRAGRYGRAPDRFSGVRRWSPALPTRIETRHTLWGGDTNPWDRAGPAELTSYPLACVTHYEFANAPGGKLSMTWYDGGLMPPTPHNTPAGARMDPGGGVLYVGDAGILIHETYGNRPTLIGDGVEARAAAIPQSLPRIQRRPGRPRDELDPQPFKAARRRFPRRSRPLCRSTRP